MLQPEHLRCQVPLAYHLKYASVLPHPLRPIALTFPASGTRDPVRGRDQGSVAGSRVPAAWKERKSDRAEWIREEGCILQVICEWNLTPEVLWLQ